MNKFIALVLVLAMILSLAACGSKEPPASDKDLESMTEENWEEYLEGLDEAIEQEEQVDPTPAEDEGPFPRDPRWDELQPGETAVQYYDIFIKSGMTVGEVVEAVENSNVYQEQFITLFFGNYIDIDPNEENDYDSHPNSLGRIETKYDTIYIKCDDDYIMSIYFLRTLPGEEGATYHVGDLPVILVSPHYYRDSTLTFMGSVGDIKDMGRQDTEGLLDVFQARGMETEMETGRRVLGGHNYFDYNFESRIPLSISCNGYSLWGYLSIGDAEPANSFIAYSGFSVDADSDKMYEHWSLDSMDKGGMLMNHFYWAADEG